MAAGWERSLRRRLFGRRIRPDKVWKRTCGKSLPANDPPITWELLPQDRKLPEEGNETAWHQVGLRWLLMQFLESKLKIATFAQNVFYAA